MTFLSSFLSIFSQDPTVLFAQFGLLFLGSILVFLLLFATRDILLRTHALLYQVVCIVLVALLPGIGFLLYLLIRPARTIKEREVETILKCIARAPVFPNFDLGSNGHRTHSAGSGQALDSGQREAADLSPKSQVPSPKSSQPYAQEKSSEQNG